MYTYYKSPLGINFDGNSYYYYTYHFLNLLKRAGDFVAYQTFADMPSWGYTSDPRGAQRDASGYVSALLGAVSGVDASGNPVELYGYQRVGIIFDDRQNYGQGLAGPYLGVRPPNPYVLTWEGSGTLSIANALLLSSTTNRQVYNLSSGNCTLFITQIDSSNYPKNIKIVPLEYDGQCSDETPFHPTFLHNISAGPHGVPRFSCLRTMTLQAINDVQGSSYYDLNVSADPPEGKMSYGIGSTQYSSKLPYKILTRLANTTNCDLWMCMPGASSAERSEYISAVAQFMCDNLNPDLNLYVEYSNETWNSLFPANQYVTNAGVAMFSSVPGYSDYDKNRLYHAYITDKIGKIFKDVFEANGYQRSRVRSVLGVQSAGEWHVSAIMVPYLLASSTSSVDYIAGAPYFGDEFAYQWEASALQFETSSPSQIARELYNLVVSGISLSATASALYPDRSINLQPGDVAISSVNQGMRYANTSRIRGLAQYCAANGFRYIAYEGGPHMVPKYPHIDSSYMINTISPIFASANRDPWMGSAVYEYLKGWNEETSGALFCYFTDLSPYSQYGYWGADEDFFHWGQSEKAQALDLYAQEFTVFTEPPPMVYTLALFTSLLQLKN